MEINALSDGVVRIKGKSATLYVDPGTAKLKNPADMTLLLGDSKTPVIFDDMLGVVVQGAGEYEVKGVKVTGFRAEGDVMYTVVVDGVSVFVGKVSSSAKAKDKLHEHNLALLKSDEVLTQVTMGQINPQAVLFYGEKATENTKAFGKENAEVAGKYSVTKDKLPSETEIVLLG